MQVAHAGQAGARSPWKAQSTRWCASSVASVAEPDEQPRLAGPFVLRNTRPGSHAGSVAEIARCAGARERGRWRRPIAGGCDTTPAVSAAAQPAGAAASSRDGPWGRTEGGGGVGSAGAVVRAARGGGLQARRGLTRGGAVARRRCSACRAGQGTGFRRVRPRRTPPADRTGDAALLAELPMRRFGNARSKSDSARLQRRFKTSQSAAAPGNRWGCPKGGIAPRGAGDCVHRGESDRMRSHTSSRRARSAR